MTRSFMVHLMLTKGAKIISKPLMKAIPRVGDEIRLAEGVYYKVEHVIWVLDEPDYPYPRVNIGLGEVE